uniref:Phorbol-ester/DAG-type domain-containing protein n=1 Tax=Quercus lobata TaxID=97700 RepID=A0A7N2R0Q0_QUELO
MEQPQQQDLLLHFSHQEHPLVFDQDSRYGAPCCGCRESVYGPSYYCIKCSIFPIGLYEFFHHKSCAELPLRLRHPLHPIHPLILSYQNPHHQKTKCQVCNESRRQYTYRCYHCNFNLHATCASLPPTIQSSQVHHHPLTPFWKWMSFTCDLCAKEVKGIPNQCALCGFWVHNSCASLPRTLKVIRHKHLLHLTHSYLEVGLYQSDSRFCQLCVQKVNTNFGFYYCSRCDFVTHLDCAADYRNRENKNLQELIEGENEDLELEQSAAYEVKNIKLGEDGTEIAAKIQHFSHEHDLKLSDDEVLNNEKCDGCIQAIFPSFYSCVNCNFFLHESCAKLPRKKRHPLHEHPLTLFSELGSRRNRIQCYACQHHCNGFTYWCETCYFKLDVPCSLISDILTHPGHEH